MLLREGSIAGGLVEPYSASVSTTNVLNRIINAAQSAFCQLGEGAGWPRGPARSASASPSSPAPTESGEPYVSGVRDRQQRRPASPHCDGWITYAMPDCSKTVYIDSVEMLERIYPLRFRSLRLLPDSGGAGRLRGGPASEVVYGPSATPMRAFYMADFALNPPQGVLGGVPGMAASARVISADGSERAIEPIGDSLLEPGQWIRGVEAGGGGYGDPLDRDPQAVLYDVLEGWVSAEAARRGLRRGPEAGQGPRRPARRRGRDAAASRGPAGDRDQARRSGELSHGSLDDPEATAVHYGPTDRYLWCTGPEE